MAYPEKNAHYRNKPAWMDRVVAAEKRADGGMASQDMKPTDPTITSEEVKTWGSADNARAAARARENAERNPVPESEKREMQNRMGRGMGQTLGWKRGGSV